MAKELLPLFIKLKKLLKPYQKKLVVVSDYESRYELRGDTEYYVFSDRTKKQTLKHGAFFTGIIIQRNYVGFYFMPIYMYQKEFTLSKELKKALKGKSCFHITELNPTLEKEIQYIIKQGFALFKKEKLI